MSDPARQERTHHPEQEKAELLRRTAEVAGVVAATEDQIAATLEQVAQHRSPSDAQRLRAMAKDARAHAARERDRAASYRMRGGDDGQADEPGRRSMPSQARSVDNVGIEPQSRESRREQIGQRLDAIRARLDELYEKRQGEALPAMSSERLIVAQHHAATSQAAAEQATGASARASRRTADSHERAAIQHERAAAAGFGDKDEHERQAAIHRAAAAAETQRAQDAQITAPEC